ncbi:hypothetical protein [Nocardia shimofusensis]|uniref:hypothetical protein n=1 Tax=Nocardia shimofusensis TaxID=228596 RepID=UPI0008365247|nr:hypothetical protein [Nocardia shimofusensis]
MHTIDEVKHRVNDVMGKVIGAGGERTSTRSVTIAVPRDQVEDCWRDPVRLSRVLGDTGEIRPTADSIDWIFGHDDGPRTTWQTTLTTEPNGLRFSGDLAGAEAELRVEFAQAPKDLGTEVNVRMRSPLPGLLTGAMAFKLLYRMRALLQSGEFPTLEYNPSARSGAR